MADDSLRSVSDADERLSKARANFFIRSEERRVW